MLPVSCQDRPLDSHQELPSELRSAKASVNCPALRQQSFPGQFQGSEWERGSRTECLVQLDEPRPRWPR